MAEEEAERENHLAVLNHSQVLPNSALLGSRYLLTQKSLKHSGKYLGIAEVIGPLDREAHCDIWTEKKYGTQGIVPVRWIVAKDVPFARFHDLRYHQQHVTQVRHGNTIPGEIGRLVIQRYFEAAHGPTAVLHPLSQTAHGVTALHVGPSQSPAGDKRRGWSAPVNRHETSRDKFSPFQHGYAGFRYGFRYGFQRGSSERWSRDKFPNLVNKAPTAPSSAFGGLSQPVPGSFNSPGRRRSTLANAPRSFRGAHGSIFGRPSYELPRDCLTSAPWNGTPSQSERRLFQQRVGQHQ